MVVYRFSMNLKLIHYVISTFHVWKKESASELILTKKNILRKYETIQTLVSEPDTPLYCNCALSSISANGLPVVLKMTSTCYTN